jgi:hypothetical protein
VEAKNNLRTRITPDRKESFARIDSFREERSRLTRSSSLTDAHAEEARMVWRGRRVEEMDNSGRASMARASLFRREFSKYCFDVQEN